MKMTEYKWDTRWPDELPGNWVFPAPPVHTTYWTTRDWVMYAAPYNKSLWIDKEK